MLIHVCFALYDKTGRYSKFTGTAMLSLFENTASEVTVHILHDNTLPADNRDKFIYIAGRYGQHVKFYNVETLCADRIAEIKTLFHAATQTRYSIATFYRFLIPKVFPPEIEKVIYLDSDIVVNLDIRELWQIELGDKPLAAANETEIDAARLKRSIALKYLIVQKLVAYDDYFNAGVLLLNLNFLRGDDESINRGLKFLSEHPQMIWLDQDVLNYLYAANYVKLSEKFDVFVDVERTKSAEVKARRAIYHYAVEALALNTGDALNRLWMEYFMRTPFFDADTIGRLYDGFRRTQFGLKQLLLSMTTTLRDRRRAFFVDPRNSGSIKKIFAVRTDEDVIIADNQAAPKKLLDAMKKARGKKIFFICVPNFPFAALIQAGFVFGKDFVNGLDFLSEAQGVPLNSNALVKAM